MRCECGEPADGVEAGRKDRRVEVDVSVASVRGTVESVRGTEGKICQEGKKA